MGACHSKAALTHRFGPAGWHASTKACHHTQGHWKNFKQVAQEKHNKKHERINKERSTKERSAKERSKKEKHSKELSTKEKAAKKKEKADKAKAKEKKAKADERRSKELQTNERSTKEKNNKERTNKTKEKNAKAQKPGKYGEFVCGDHSTATRICRAIANGHNLNVRCNGMIWNVGKCGQGVEVNVDAKKTHNCSCSPSARSITFRPCIHNSNWGGYGKSCSSHNYNQKLSINCGGHLFSHNFIKNNSMKNVCNPMRNYRKGLMRHHSYSYIRLKSS